MSKSIYASVHGSLRMKERIGNINNDKVHLKNVVQNGKTKKDFRGDLYYYILNKESKRDKKVKIYKNFVYIFNKANHSLITVYPVPEEFLPIEQFEYNEYEKEIINNISMYEKIMMDIETKDDLISGKAYFIEDKPKEMLEVILKDNTNLIINIKDIIKFDLSIHNYQFDFVN